MNETRRKMKMRICIPKCNGETFAGIEAHTRERKSEKEEGIKSSGH